MAPAGEADRCDRAEAAEGLLGKRQRIDQDDAVT
jgi:hypothetical protein